MRPRQVDLAFDWMRSQPRGAFHYPYRVRLSQFLATFHGGQA
ncbi:hypothetical protein ABT168_23465 [Streptomyces sp. NPDC001793]